MNYIIRSRWRVAMVLVDLAIFAAAFWLSFYLRFDSFNFGKYTWSFRAGLPVIILLEFAGMYFAGVYRSLWRYTSVDDLLKIIRGALYGTFAFMAWVIIFRSHGFPRSLYLINGVLVVCGTGGIRFARRIWVERFLSSRSKPQGRPVLIVGAGDAADDLIRELRHNPRLTLQPAGIVDDEPEKMGQELHGVKVIGTLDDLPGLAAETGAEEILIAIPSAVGAQMRRIVEICRATGVPFRTMPGAGDILGGKVHVHHLRKVLMEDLLRRPPVRLDHQAVSGFISGRKVMVTGAAGSIGSELCRQIARFGPTRITLLDHNENNLFYLEEEFSRVNPRLPWMTVVADVTNRAMMDHVMQRESPDVVFHAAAHKHVPLMERNLHAAIVNNVLGTRVVAETAAAAGAETFVMISTDKAVNPSSIMGVSKRIAEKVIQSLNATSRGTEFVSVRFGNVMGSEGSVIPLFARQIEAGGPVTVTDPAVVRYFMTIPEAVQLVLQAAAMGRGGEIFILDMGEPIRILDLARDMIRLSGLEPEVDIPIIFTGLRGGEKLSEELMIGGEGVAPTPHEKIMVFKAGGGPGEGVMERVIELEQLALRCQGPREIMALVRELVPEFKAPGNAGKP